MLPERIAHERLTQDLNTLNRELGRDDALPRLRFDLRGRCAGLALPQQWTIRLNNSLLQQHGEEFVADTVPHELAHLVAYAEYGRKIRPHGREWAALMSLLGRPASVCHNYAVQPARKILRYPYHCDCQRHELSSIRHARVMKGQRYQCRRCGQTLRQGDGPHAK